jgi:hypothetical protein
MLNFVYLTKSDRKKKICKLFIFSIIISLLNYLSLKIVHLIKNYTMILIDGLTIHMIVE